MLKHNLLLPAANPSPLPSRFPGGQRLGPILVAVAATLATLLTLAPSSGGPGVTCDEPYHVLYGKRLVTAWRTQGPGFFSPRNIRRNFSWQPGGAPVHPPLGNWLLGWANDLVDPNPDEPAAISIVAPRFVSAIAFGLLVLWVGLATVRMAGPLAGTVAAAGVCLVPRVFGHAHLAALDMLTTLWFVGAILAVIAADARGGRWWHYAIAGVVWGLAMLTRLSGVLVGPPVVVWLLWRLRRRAFVPLGTWAAAGLGTLFAGWPWLWVDTVAHVRQFLDTATNRISIHVYYLGSVWGDTPDHQAPWHYTPVMFVLALPLGLFVLGLLGLWARSVGWDKRSAVPPAKGPAHSGGTALCLSHPTVPDRAPNQALGYWLIMGSLAFVLVAFSWPGRPMYDGVRLFLMALPLWAVSVGIGAKWLAEHWPLGRWPARARIGVLAAIVAAQGVGLILYHPCYLSHYNLLVGGLPGAEKLGFEVTYWGDSVTEDLFRELAPRANGETIVFGPSLAPYQVYVGILSQSLGPLLDAGKTHFELWSRKSPSRAEKATYAVIYRREANLADLPAEIVDGDVVVERRVLGVWVARVVEIPSRRHAPLAYNDPIAR